MSLNPRLRSWPARRVWIVGASSGIGLALAEALLARGAIVCVSARRAQPLEALGRRWPLALPLALDASVPGELEQAARTVFAAGPPDLVVYCAGHYAAMRATAFDLAEALRHQEVNYGGALRLLGAVLPRMLRAGRGHISLVASVAGYRGLPLALAYGPTKAALINLAETLHQDLRPSGIGVSVVNPGFVATPMTARNGFRMPALTSVEAAAQAMLEGWERGAFEIDFPRRFTWPMRALSLLPFGLYRALVRQGTGA
jgi:NAD(P)-dependent dehydrogenase (short-subunit alcohol dehydrogenase family)